MLDQMQSVLELKTRPPEVPPSLVRRGRLEDRLTAAAGGPVTLVSAGPGAGKTLMVASWVGSGRVPGAAGWLSLDSADDNPRSFWSSVIFALNASGGVPDRSGLRDIAPATKFGPAEVFDVRALLAELPAPVVLILDDLQEITDDTVLQTFGELVDHLPPALRLVLVSRSDPMLRLHRLRVSGSLTEIRTADLAFTESETAELFDGAGIRLAAEQVRVLRERTEGWPAGLRLAAMSMDSGDLQAEIDRFSGSDVSVADYLVGEVTQRLSPADRDFLLKTSVVDRLNGELAGLVTGRTDGQQVLEELVRRNAFVVGLGGRQGSATAGTAPAQDVQDAGTQEGDDEPEQGAHLEADVAGQVVVQAAAQFDGLDDGGEVVVGQDHHRGFLGHLGAGDAHRDADVGPLERGGVVDPVAGHRHHLSGAL